MHGVRLRDGAAGNDQHTYKLHDLIKSMIKQEPVPHCMGYGVTLLCSSNRTRAWMVSASSGGIPSRRSDSLDSRPRSERTPSVVTSLPSGLSRTGFRVASVFV